MLDIEICEEFGKPPRGGLLYQMRIPSIGEYLLGRSSRNSEKSNIFCNPEKVFYDVRQKLLFDMFQHVDAADEIRGFGLSVTREDRIIGEIIERPHAIFFEANFEIAFSRAIIRYGMRVNRLQNLFNDGGVGQRRYAVMGILMEGGLKIEIRVRYRSCHFLCLWKAL